MGCMWSHKRRESRSTRQKARSITLSVVVHGAFTLASRESLAQNSSWKIHAVGLLPLLNAIFHTSGVKPCMSLFCFERQQDTHAAIVSFVSTAECYSFKICRWKKFVCRHVRLGERCWIRSLYNHLTWDDIDDWEINHRRPLSESDLKTEEGRKAGFNYQNTRPVHWVEHAIKTAAERRCRLRKQGIYLTRELFQACLLSLGQSRTMNSLT